MGFQSPRHHELREGEPMNFDLIVFSHLRWDFVFQRPQHLLTRAAKQHRVLFVEEPIHSDQQHFEIRHDPSGVTICVPHLSPNLGGTEKQLLLQKWVASLVESEGLDDYAIWFYTPMMLPLAERLHPKAVVYDCMDELSAFKFAPPELTRLERELLSEADVVFTGGHSLFEAKCTQHDNVHAMPSSVDAAHFHQARGDLPEPPEMAQIPHPRVGFIGVIDERMDIDLLGEVAQRLPQVHFVMVGPVVKIDPASLPQSANLHYLGGRSYTELPAYLSHWDAAILPFALNESTRYISPTKTPEYLAAGKAVVSTPIRDVVRPYGEQDLVQIAGDADTFAEATMRALTEDQTERGLRADKLISGMSWDGTWRKMEELISKAIMKKFRSSTVSQQTVPQQNVPALPLHLNKSQLNPIVQKRESGFTATKPSSTIGATGGAGSD
jgi:glycosyltransferase involved in cell wall biosynthesis